MRKNAGFTLLEIAMVLVLVGLLLTGVLKGSDLITSARVRNLALQLDETKVAYLGFHDRFGKYPGDIPTATANGLLAGNPGGCTGGTGCANGEIDPDERYVVWAHLSRAGFLSNRYSGL